MANSVGGSVACSVPELEESVCGTPALCVSAVHEPRRQTELTAAGQAQGIVEERPIIAAHIAEAVGDETARPVL